MPPTCAARWTIRSTGSRAAVARLRRLGQEALDGQAVAEIALLAVGRDELSDTARAECRDHRPAEEASTARDEHSLVRPRLVVVEPPVGHAGLCNSSIGRALRPAIRCLARTGARRILYPRHDMVCALPGMAAGYRIAMLERPRWQLRAGNPSEMTPVRPTFYLAGVGRSSEAAPQTGIV